MAHRVHTHTSNPSPAAAGEGRGGPTLAAVVLLALSLLPSRAAAVDPFADEVVSFTAGAHAGFGADELPGIVLGPPRGNGDAQGSFDAVSLGDGGVIVVAFRDGVICDQPGVDFTIFENAFLAGGTTVFAEVGIVAVSGDGVDFVEFPYDPQTFAGLAGKTPVYSHPDNDIDPLDPSVSGGDSFDLADIGVASISYIRITDPGATIDDLGNHIPPGINAGFDLDAIAALHLCAEGLPSPTPSATASPTPSGTATGSPGPSATNTRRPTPTPTEDLRTPTASAMPTHLAGDANGDGVVDAADLPVMVSEMFDGDGDEASAASGGLVQSSPGVDRNRDGRVTVADMLHTD